jgi:hypothetical protein
VRNTCGPRGAGWKSGLSFLSFTCALRTLFIVSFYDAFEIRDQGDTQMAEKNKDIAVFGIYPHRATCEYALSVLHVAGFRSPDISILLQEKPGGVARATGSGAAMEGTLGWLAGTNAVTVPSLAPLIVAGPIVAAVEGAGFGGELRGLAGAMKWLGIRDSEARKYQGKIESGGILLSIHCETPVYADKAKVLLISTGAEEISATNEPETDHNGTDRPRRRATSG